MVEKKESESMYPEMKGQKSFDPLPDMPEHEKMRLPRSPMRFIKICPFPLTRLSIVIFLFGCPANQRIFGGRKSSPSVRTLPKAFKGFQPIWTLFKQLLS